MKLLAELQKQVGRMGTLRRAWFTSFNTDIEFVETYVLPTTLGANTPRNRIEYEQLQQELTKEDIDFRVFCDPRFLETNRVKRTCIPVHGIRPQRKREWFSEASLFHAKVIYLEDREGKRVIGAGSANLTLSGWGRNLEVFQFFEISTYANYREIRRFFEHLCDAADIPCSLDERRNFTGKPEKWRFVHSFQEKPFPEQLLAGVRDMDLAVWSPYLPRDLAGFIGRLQAASGADGLRVHLVPDRIEGRYLRTQWSDELSRLKADRRLTFYDRPVACHASTELCHAKLWKLPDKLAVGSWNFTGPGSNCLRDDQGDWSPDNNVEAGFIIDDRNNWREANGKPLDLGAGDCATADLLDKESLVVNSLPPFDLHVSFDWHAQAYTFHGTWLADEQRDDYSVRLPGVADAVPLTWNTRRSPEQPGHLSVDDSALLRDRVFKVMRAGKEIQRGLVSELHAKSRRAQAFDTLQDLLEAFVHGDDPQSLHDLPFRIPLDTDAFADNALAAAVDEDAPLIGDASPRGGISYFRLFQSIHAYQQKLLKLEKLEALDSHVFSWPGCLLELVGKTRVELQKSGREVFKWFLANEVLSLCECARSRRRSLVRGLKEREPRYTAVPETRWRELVFEVPALPTGVSAQYSDLIRNQCRYG
ncbi:phospholipase D family protein [Paraburkholderia caribensis]|uniref:phospholipase D family protein n=1 Tax=Paraburkholderia caribensis TaxID=75105 RepID=UPI0034D1D65B